MKARPTVAVLDYGIGNIRSMLNALQNVGCTATLTRDPSAVLESDVLILPGVGAFKSGMDNLLKFHLDELIHNFVSTGKVFIGICLGMQMMFEESEEFGITRGLALIEGKVKKLKEEPEARLPNVSWNILIVPSSKRWENTLLEDSSINDNFYFVHSYVGVPTVHADILANSEYGSSEFCAAVQKNNIYGFQFHPEKSGTDGLKIFKNLKTIL